MNNAMPAKMSTMKQKPAKPTMRGFSVRYADNGGAIVTHDMSPTNGPYTPDPQHVFSTPAEVHAHLKSIYPVNGKPAPVRANLQEPGEQA